MMCVFFLPCCDDHDMVASIIILLAALLLLLCGFRSLLKLVFFRRQFYLATTAYSSTTLRQWGTLGNKTCIHFPYYLLSLLGGSSMRTSYVVPFLNNLSAHSKQQ